jgi:hypothetical protein
MVKGKVLIGAYISEDVDTKFRQFLSSKYKEFRRGTLSHEVETALSHWVAMHTKAQKSDFDSVPNPLPKVSQVYLQVKRYLLSKYYEELAPGSTVPTHFFEEAIMQTRGSDSRTISKWTRIFQESNIIKRLSPFVWELVA